IFTPGHEVDHVAFHLRADRVLFTGDCVLGASSSTVRDLASYMQSLQLLTTYQHDTICPGHGPVVLPPRGAELVRWYMHHREERVGLASYCSPKSKSLPTCKPNCSSCRRSSEAVSWRTRKVCGPS